MKEYGIVRFISTRGLGWEGDVMLYQEGDKLLVVSQMSGNLVPVEWIEEGKVVGYPTN